MRKGKTAEQLHPAEGATLIVGEATAVYQAIQGHDIAAASVAILALLPALITFGVGLWRSAHQG